MRRSLRPNQYLRMIENRFVSSESTFIDLDAWDACVDPDAAPMLQDRNLPVWIDFDATIARTVRDLMKRFAARGVYYDPYQMAAVAQRLQQAGVPMREFPQTVGNLTEIASGLFELVKSRALVAYPDADIRLAISRAIAIE